MSTCGLRQNLNFCKGATFRWGFGVGTEKLQVLPLQSISNSTPAVFTCSEHGIPAAWPVSFLHLPTSFEDWRYHGKTYAVRVLDDDTFYVPELDGRGKTYAVEDEGMVMYQLPMDLSGGELLMQVRPEEGSEEILLSIEPGSSYSSIEFDEHTNSVQVKVSYEIIDSVEFEFATYTVLYKEGGVSTRLAGGNVFVVEGSASWIAP